MIKIGITGGIGSGKSYIAHLLEQRGIPLYDTDREAKRLTVTHPQIRKNCRICLERGFIMQMER